MTIFLGLSGRSRTWSLTIAYSAPSMGSLVGLPPTAIKIFFACIININLQCKPENVAWAKNSRLSVTVPFWCNVRSYHSRQSVQHDGRIVINYSIWQSFVDLSLWESVCPCTLADEEATRNQYTVGSSAIVSLSVSFSTKQSFDIALKLALV